MTSDTTANERGLSSSDCSGEEITKEICDAARKEGSSGSVTNTDVSYHIYENELNIPDIMRLIQRASAILHLQILHPQLAQPLLHGKCTFDIFERPY